MGGFEVHIEAATQMLPAEHMPRHDSVEAWFALSAFADNASLYEQVVRGGDNANATVLAGRALMGAARRVDAALQSARVSSSLQSGWASLKGQLGPIDTQG